MDSLFRAPRRVSAPARVFAKVPAPWERGLMASVLSIHSSREGDRHTLTLTGELDMASTPVLEAKANQLVSQGARELVLDLGQLEFIDSSGLTSILRVRSLCEEHMC